MCSLFQGKFCNGTSIIVEFFTPNFKTENQSDLPFLSFCRGDKLQITGFFVSERKSYA